MLGNEPGCVVSACNAWEVQLRHINLGPLGKIYIYLCQRHWRLYKNRNLVGDRDL
jgi:hypothetical protein